MKVGSQLAGFSPSQDQATVPYSWLKHWPSRLGNLIHASPVFHFIPFQQNAIWDMVNEEQITIGHPIKTTLTIWQAAEQGKWLLVQVVCNSGSTGQLNLCYITYYLCYLKNASSHWYACMLISWQFVGTLAWKSKSSVSWGQAYLHANIVPAVWSYYHSS